MLGSPYFPSYFFSIVLQISSLVLSSTNYHTLIDFWGILRPVPVVLWISLTSLMPVQYPLGVFVTQKDSFYINVDTHDKARSFNGY